MNYHAIQCDCGFEMIATPQQEGQIVFCGSCNQDLFIPQSRSGRREASRILLRCIECRRIWYGPIRMAGKLVPCPLCEKPLRRNRRERMIRPEEATLVESPAFAAE